MEKLTRADVVKMLYRINELTERVLLLEKEAVKPAPKAKAAPKKKAK